MNRKIPWYTLTALLLALALAFAPMQSAFADDDSEIEILATLISIDEEDGSLVVETEEGETYTVYPPEDFDFSLLQVGDLLEIEGTLNEDGSIDAFKVKVEYPDKDDTEPVEKDDDPSGGYYCMQSEVPHPFGALLANRYETDYETLQGWFCDGFGWGQIMLALQTAGQVTDMDAESLLAARSDGQGWGQIWQGLGLIGRPEDAGPPEGRGRPEGAGPPEGKGPPEGRGGPPEGKGPPPGKGPNRP
jgi:hypothetical protein